MSAGNANLPHQPQLSRKRVADTGQTWMTYMHTERSDKKQLTRSNATPQREEFSQCSEKGSAGRRVSGRADGAPKTLPTARSLLRAVCDAGCVR